MTHEYMKSEEVAAIREFYQTLPLDLDSSVLAVRRDFLRLIDDWQVLMAENQRLREELELLRAEGPSGKGGRKSCKPELSNCSNARKSWLRRYGFMQMSVGISRVGTAWRAITRSAPATR